MWDIKPEDYALLVVDDDEQVLRAIYRDLFDAGFRVAAFSESPKALQFLETLKAAGRFDEQLVYHHSFEEDAPCVGIDAIIADVRMPGIDGIEFLTRSRATFPKAVRYVLTGYADVNFAVGALNRARAQYYFTKPWNWEEVIAQLNTGLSLYKAQAEAETLREMNARNLAAVLEEVVRLSNGHQQRVIDHRRGPFASHATHLETLFTRLGLDSEDGPMARAVGPIREELEEYVKTEDAFLQELESGVGRRLVSLATCLNFLQATSDPEQALEKGPVDYRELIEGALRAAEPSLAAKRVKAEATMSASLGVLTCSRGVLSDAWSAVMGIAADLAAEGGALTVSEAPRAGFAGMGRVALVEAGPKTHAIVTVEGDLGATRA
ncbi:MAG: response regulator, partial [Candidatus Methylomirabilis sp.]|nr:response regulator [Deltaproteobacteria bacterium]